MNRKLVYYGNETLRKVADKVKNINKEVIDLINTMYNVMYEARGVGLAGPQIDVSKKIITIDLYDPGRPRLALINPEIISNSDEVEPYEEGCLSLPGISESVIRPCRITVKGFTPDEKEVMIDADGLLARVLQHEIDHLNGIVFIDHLEDHIKKRLRSDLKKIKKLNKES
jgi:peptide deformylase